MIFSGRVFDFKNDRNQSEERLNFIFRAVGVGLEKQTIGSGFIGRLKNDSSVGIRRLLADSIPILSGLFFECDRDAGSRVSKARVEDVSADHEDFRIVGEFMKGKGSCGFRIH